MIYVPILFTFKLTLCRLTKVNPQGTVPILKDIETDGYIVDSDTISDYLEQKYAGESEFPKKPLGNVADCPQP